MKRSMKASICAFAFTLIPSTFAHAQMLREPYPEKLYAYSLDRKGLNFQVYSGGCTDRRNFKISMTENGPVRQIVLYRVVHDACLALFPYGVGIHYEFNELALSRGQFIQILNPMREIEDRREEP